MQASESQQHRNGKSGVQLPSQPGPSYCNQFPGGDFWEQSKRGFKLSPLPDVCNPTTEVSIPVAFALPPEGPCFVTIGPWHLTVETLLTAGFPRWEEEPS